MSRFSTDAGTGPSLSDADSLFNFRPAHDPLPSRSMSMSSSSSGQSLIPGRPTRVIGSGRRRGRIGPSAGRSDDFVTGFRTVLGLWGPTQSPFPGQRFVHGHVPKPGALPELTAEYSESSTAPWRKSAGWAEATAVGRGRIDAPALVG